MTTQEKIDALKAITEVLRELSAASGGFIIDSKLIIFETQINLLISSILGDLQNKN